MLSPGLALHPAPAASPGGRPRPSPRRGPAARSPCAALRALAARPSRRDPHALSGPCAVVIDLESQTVLRRRTYRGTMADPQPLTDGQLEVTWAEGGAVRIVGAGARQRWRWSQPRAAWE